MSTPLKLCFDPPAPDARFDAHRARVKPIALPEITLNTRSILTGLSDATASALANILPCLLCGEESAVRVFSNEGRRLEDDLHQCSQETLFRISAEEEYHEVLLNHISLHLPEADQFAKRRQLSKRYFMRLLSRDRAEHFARIAALDSAVCIILAEMCMPGGPFPRGSAVAAIFARIRHDEGHHVAFSHHYASELAITNPAYEESFHMVRDGLIELLRWCGNGFDDLAVDPDRLFKRLAHLPLRSLPVKRIVK